MTRRKPIWGQWHNQGTSARASLGYLSSGPEIETSIDWESSPQSGDADSPTSLGVSGDIWLSNKDELRRFLRISSTSVEDIIRVGLARHGIGMLERLRGQFSFAAVNQKIPQLILCRDIIGNIPLFFTIIGDKILWSSTIQHLLGAMSERRVNLDYFIDYLSGAPAAPHETPYQKIFQVPPGSYLRAGVDDWEVLRYWTFDQTDAIDSCEALDLFETIFHQSIAEMLNGLDRDSIAVRLSGGYDSSSVLVGLREVGVPLQAVTVIFPGVKSNESRFVDYLATALGVDTMKVRANSEIRRSELPSRRFQVSPFFDPYEREMGEMYTVARSKGWHNLFTGTYGDEFCYPFFPMDDVEAWLGGLFLRRRLGYDRPAPFLSKFGQKQFVEQVLRHWDLYRGLSMGSLCTFLGWGSAVQIESIYEASINHDVNMMSPFMTDRMMELSARLPQDCNTVGHAFKPILSSYLRKHGLNYIAERRGKASLGSYFRRHYIEEARNRLLSPEIFGKLERSGIINTQYSRGMLEVIPHKLPDLLIDDILRLWQLGEFLKEGEE